MRSMMSLLTAMSSRMDQYERARDGRHDSTSVHAVYAVPPEPTTSRATAEYGPVRCPGAADGYRDVSEEVRTCVASHLRGAPALFVSTDDESASGDEGMLPACWKRGLKSGKVRTMDSIVTKKMVWPHKVVF